MRSALAAIDYLFSGTLTEQFGRAMEHRPETSIQQPAHLALASSSEHRGDSFGPT